MRKGKRPHVAKSISDKLNRVAQDTTEGPSDTGPERKFDSDDSEFDEEREFRPKKKKPVDPNSKGNKPDKAENYSSGDEPPAAEETETWKPVGVMQ